MRVAFHAPLKDPGHPVPSGDRQMGRLLLTALRAGGHTVEVASTLRTFLSLPDPARQAGIEEAARAEAHAIESRWSKADAARPDAWLTYHPFYKAPDLLGPRLTRTFGIPYATAEASHAPKRAGGPWAAWHAATEAAIRAAAVHFCFTDQDREGLERVGGARGRIIPLPPFIDAAPFRGSAPRPEGGPVKFVAVAMMRPGDKTRSFAFLARALAALPPDLAWHMSVVGDGPARNEVHSAFAAMPAGRMSFLGLLGPAEIGRVLAAADLYVWPGFNEAYGMSYLEAGAAGLPALAMRSGGIANVIEHGTTGLLVPEGDLEAFTRALAGLTVDGALRRTLGAAARTMVTRERTVFRAAAVLDLGLREALSVRSGADT